MIGTWNREVMRVGNRSEVEKGGLREEEKCK